VFGGSEDAIAVAAPPRSCAECQAAYAHVTSRSPETSPTPSAPPGVRELLDPPANSRRDLVYADRLANLFGLEPVVADRCSTKAYEKRAGGRSAPASRLQGGGRRRKGEARVRAVAGSCPAPSSPSRPRLRESTCWCCRAPSRKRGPGGVGEARAVTTSGHEALAHALDGENCIAAVVTLKERRL